MTGKIYDFLTWSDLAKRWKIFEFQLIKYLQKGLTPYSHNGNVVECPAKYHEYYYLHKLEYENKETIKNLKSDPAYKKLAADFLLFETEVKQNYTIKEIIKKFERKNLNLRVRMEIIEKEDPHCISWKYFMNPVADGELDLIFSDLKKTIFKIKDVLSFEKKYELSDSNMNLKTLFKKSSSELIRLYSVIIDKFGSALENFDSEIAQEIILNEYNENKNFYKLIKKEYLNDIKIYNLSEGQSRRDFIGRLLLKIFQDKNIGVKGAHKIYMMFKTYEKESTIID